MSLENTTLAIDIGGTKIAAGILTKDHQIINQITLPSERGLTSLISTIQTCIEWGTPYRFSDIAIASPGKLIGDARHHVTIAAKTAQNLESFPGEFDHLCIHTLLKSSLQLEYPIFIINDALAQLCGGIPQLPQGPKSVGYIGPGTGLGGGFAELSANGPLKFKTDGHIFDIMLERDCEDKWSPPGKWVMSEDVVSGRGFCDITGISVMTYFQSPKNYPHIAPIWAMFERYMITLFKTLKSAQFIKKEPTNNWSSEDRLSAAQSTYWLIGGSVGQRLFPAIQHQIQLNFPNDQLFVIPSTKTASLIGVVYARDLT